MLAAGRPPPRHGRAPPPGAPTDLESLLASDAAADWVLPPCLTAPSSVRPCGPQHSADWSMPACKAHSAVCMEVWTGAWVSACMICP